MATVTDATGRSATKTMTATVSAAISVPDVVGQSEASARSSITGANLTVGTVTSQPSATVPAGSVISQSPPAASLAQPGDPVAFVLSTGPVAGTDADKDTFTVEGGDCNDGDASIHPGAVDEIGDGIDQDCDGKDGNLTVTSVTVTPSGRRVLTGDDLQLRAFATFSDGSATDVTDVATWGTSAPASATVSSSGLVHAGAAGMPTLTATFRTVPGTAPVTVVARIADATVPVAAITSPTTGATVATLTDVLGTASDANLLRWQLDEAQPDGASAVVAEGTTSLSAALLGRIDGTSLRNGSHRLTLTVYDTGGNTAQATQDVVVDGEMKLGDVNLSFIDLQVPVAGVPVTVRRSYSSLDRTLGDFGSGWRLDISTMRPTATPDQGADWQSIRSGSTYFLVPTKAHTVSVTLPNGMVETFDLGLSPSQQTFAPLEQANAIYTARPGTVGKLAVDGNDQVLIDGGQPGPIDLLDNDTLALFDPVRFVYTTPDGTAYHLDRTSGLRSIRDLNGNGLDITPTSITHTSGKAITFVRDGSGRITKVTSPRGDVQTYAYDADGNLAAHTAADGAITRFRYDGSHHLVRVVDPLGRPAQRNEYDAAGRLVGTVDANGRRTTFVHDPATRLEAIADQLGRQTIQAYDANGDVVSRTDGEGDTTTMTYGPGHRMLTQTDPLGHLSTWTYDVTGNVTSQTDALGLSTSATYDGMSHPLTVTDQKGATTTMGYDARGNLTAVQDADGKLTTMVIDTKGNPTSTTDPLGHTTTATYDAAGNKTGVTDPAGRATAIALDANGMPVGQDATVGPDWAMTYDPVGRASHLANGSGVTDITYDLMGQPTAVADGSGHQATVEYDDVGRMKALRRNDGSLAQGQTLDDAGQIVGMVDGAGRTTTMDYDLVGRPRSSVAPDGETESWEYDDAGRAIAHTSSRTGRATYVLDDVGRRTSATDALGNVWRWEYDEVDRVTAEIDPLGHRTEHTFDVLGRPATKTFAGGASQSWTYDSAGRTTTSTDERGKVTTYGYDDAGLLTSVTDPLGQVTTYEYDAAGRKTSMVDANAHRTTYGFDANGNQATVTHPLGQVESTTYDPEGRPLTRTDGAGRTLTYEYDARGWPKALVHQGGAREELTWTDDVQLATVTDARGTTTWDHDPVTGLVSKVTEPNGTSLTYAYDAAARRTSVQSALAGGASPRTATTTYDAIGRIASMKDPTDGTTTASYDAASNLLSLARPNGVTSTMGYDVRNRRTSVTHTGPGSTVLAGSTTTLDATGNRTAVTDGDGTKVAYAYDDLSRLLSEVHKAAGGATTSTTTFGYDAVGNLTSRNGSSSATWTYNANDQRTTGGGQDLHLRRRRQPHHRRHQRRRDPALARLGRPVTAHLDHHGRRPDQLHLRRIRRPGPDRRTVGHRRPPRRPPRPERARAGRPGEERRWPRPVPHLLGLPALDHRGWKHEPATAGRPGLHEGCRQQQRSGHVQLHLRRLRPADLRVGRPGPAPLRRRAARRRRRARLPAGPLVRPVSSATFASRDPASGDDRSPLSGHDYAYAWDNPSTHTDPTGLEPSLPGLLVSMQQQLILRGQDTLRIRQALDRVGNAVGPIAKYLGAALVVNTFLSITSRPLLWFEWFGAGFITGGVNLGKIGIDLIQRPVDFTFLAGAMPLGADRKLGIATCAPKDGFFPWAWAPRGPLASGARGWVLICPPLITATPMPRGGWRANRTQAPSMAGVMIHEYSHSTIGTQDHRYDCRKIFDLNSWGGIGRMGADVVKHGREAVANADNYRCIAEDAWVHS